MNQMLRLMIVVWGIAAVAAGASAQHGVHPPMPGQNPFLVFTLAKATEPLLQVPIQVPMASAPADLTQEVKLPDSLPAFKVTKYLPQARLEQDVVAGEGADARPAMLVSIDGTTQHYTRWMLADDPARNQLASMIATWRYLSVADAEGRDDLYRQFETELTRAPVLRISGPDGQDATELPAIAGETQKVESLGCTVRIVEFFPHFGIDKTENKPMNVSERRINPAALVEVTRDGKVQQKWVFSKFPDFRFHEEPDLPYPVRLDCPQEKKGTSPDYVLVTIGGTEHEVWARYKGVIENRKIKVDDPVKIVESNYEFHVARYVPAGVLREEYRPATGRGTVAAIRVETVDPDGKPLPLWLEVGKEQFVPTSKGPMSVVFQLSQPGDTKARGMHR